MPETTPNIGPVKEEKLWDMFTVLSGILGVEKCLLADWKIAQWERVLNEDEDGSS